MPVIVALGGLTNGLWVLVRGALFYCLKWAEIECEEFLMSEIEDLKKILDERLVGDPSCRESGVCKAHVLRSSGGFRLRKLIGNILKGVGMWVAGKIVTSWIIYNLANKTTGGEFKKQIAQFAKEQHKTDSTRLTVLASTLREHDQEWLAELYANLAAKERNQ